MRRNIIMKKLLIGLFCISTICYGSAGSYKSGSLSDFSDEKENSFSENSFSNDLSFEKITPAQNAFQKTLNIRSLLHQELEEHEKKPAVRGMMRSQRYHQNLSELGANSTHNQSSSSSQEASLSSRSSLYPTSRAIPISQRNKRSQRTPVKHPNKVEPSTDESSSDEEGESSSEDMYIMEDI